MKKIMSWIVVLSLILMGCSTTTKTTTKKIYASFGVVADLTKRIAGDRFEVETIIKNGEEPHDFELSTQQLAQLTKAELLVYNGAGFESWIDKVKEAAKQTTFVDTSKGINLIHEEDDHKDDHKDEHKEHDHLTNPHIWMSIPNAIKQMSNIKDALVKQDPNNANYYEENFKKHSTLFNELHKQYQTQLAPYKGRSIVVSHAAYTYLTTLYGLEEYAIAGLSPEDEPSLAKLAQLTKTVQEKKVKTIYFDENVSNAVTNALAKEAKVKTSILYTLEQIANGQDYLSLMKENLKALVSGFND